MCRLLSVGERLRPGRQMPSEPRKILVILLSEMGSLVLAIPMFERLKRQHPQAEIYALVFARNREALECIRQIPSDHILTLRDTSLGVLVRDAVVFARAARRLGIDTVVDAELFSRVSSILAYLSGAPRRVGFHPHRQEGLYRGGYINVPVLYNPYLHMAAQLVNLAEAIGGAGMPRVKTRPVAVETLEWPDPPFTEAEWRAARAALERDFPHRTGEPLVLLYPGGGLIPLRAWPADGYAEVAARLARRGCRIGVIGPASDRGLAQRVLSRCPADAALDLTGYTPALRDLIRLMASASLLITNDGGPAHFALLARVPTVVLFGPETPVLYRPLGPRVRVLYAGLSCSPCLTAYNHRNSPCDGDAVCLKLIAPDEVFQAALDLLAEKP